MKIIEKLAEYIAQTEPYCNFVFNTNGKCVELDGEQLNRMTINKLIDEIYEKEGIKPTQADMKDIIYTYAHQHQVTYDPSDEVRQIISADPNVMNIQWDEHNNIYILNGKDATSKIPSLVEKIMKYKQLKRYHLTNADVLPYVKEYAMQHPYVAKKTNKDNFADWYAKLEFDKDGNPCKTLNNVKTFLENYPAYKDKFSYNEFTSYENFDGMPMEDCMIPDIRLVVEMNLNFDSKDKVETAVTHLCHQSSFNPFKRIIEDIMWDGQHRAEELFIKYLGVDDTQLNRSITMKWFYAAMKRLYEPGCSFDNMPIIYDPTQGTGKSKVIERLVTCFRSIDPALSYGFDATITADTKDKDNVDKMNRSWICLQDELTEFLKSNPEATKQFLSQSIDTARLSYAKRSKDFKRHCVFIATTNVDYFLKDTTTDFERRYWIMEANGEVRSAQWWKDNLTDKYLLQVWAEVYYFYRNNPDFEYATLNLDERQQLQEVQDRHKTLNLDDVLKDKITEILDARYYKNTFTSYEDFRHTVKTTDLDNSNAVINNTVFESQQVIDDFMNETNTHNCAAAVNAYQSDNDKDKYIDTLPTKWLKRYLNDELHESRKLTSRYISKLIGWKLYGAKYKGTNENMEIIKRNTTTLI